MTSISWLPADAVKALAQLPFDIGSPDFDSQLPNEFTDLDEVMATFSCRFVNQLTAWIDVGDAGEILEAGYRGGGRTGTLEHPSRRYLFLEAPMADVQPPPEFGDDFVRFVQSVGVHGSTPVPRTLRRAPFVQWRAPMSWTTLALTMHVDGTATHELVGASQFPRHWVFNSEGRLVSRTGLVDVDDWYRTCSDVRTPWGDLDSRSLTSRVEAALERSFSACVVGASRPKVVKVAADTTLVRQGDVTSSVFLVLDGVACLEADGKRLAEYGPGALLGERAALAGDPRRASIVTVTKSRLALVGGESIDPRVWDHLATGQRREEPSAT